MRLRYPRRPILSEDSGGYTTEWYCDPPEVGVAFQVLQEEWCCPRGAAVRKIYKVRIVDKPNRHRVAADLCLLLDMPMFVV